MSNIKSEIVRAAEYVVGTLLVRAIVKSEDSDRALQIIAEELSVVRDTGGQQGVAIFKSGQWLI